jgi:uncharacterized membrane protein
MPRAGWMFAALLTAVVVHIFYVLFVPAFAFGWNAATPESNRFAVLEPEAQQRLFPAYPASSLFGVCRFDVSTSDVVLDAKLPDALWTLSIFDGKGKSLYALNDTQSGTNSFAVRLSRARGVLEQLNAPPDPDVEKAGWTVETGSAAGLAVFWVDVPQEPLRERLKARLAETNCASGKS